LALFTAETGDALEGLTRVYQMTRAPLMIEIPGLDGVRGMDLIPWTGLLGVIGKIGDKSKDTAQAQRELAAAQQSAAEKAAVEAERLQRLNDELEATTQLVGDYLDLTLSADRGAVRWEQALDRLAESVAENGKSLDITTEKGRANVDNLLDMADSAVSTRERNLRLGMSLDEANAAYDRQIDRIKWHAYHLGLDKKAIDKLIGKYEVEVNFRFVTQGLEAVIGKISGAFAGLFGLGAGKSTGPSGFWFPKGVPEQFPRGLDRQIPSFQHGGATPAFAPFRVHEGEMLFSDRQHYVATAAQTAAMSGGGAMRPILVQVIVEGKVVRQAQIDEATARGVSESAIRVAYP
jgi:hypothetical protein